MTTNPNNYGSTRELYDELENAGRHDVDIMSSGGAALERRDLSNLIEKYAEDESRFVQNKDSYLLADPENPEQVAELVHMGPAGDTLEVVKAEPMSNPDQIHEVLTPDQDLSEPENNQEKNYGLDVVR